MARLFLESQVRTSQALIALLARLASALTFSDVLLGLSYFSVKEACEYFSTFAIVSAVTLPETFRAGQRLFLGAFVVLFLHLHLNSFRYLSRT